MSKYEAVIFDMDGTILDTMVDLTESLNRSLSAYGLPEKTQNEAKANTGHGIRYYIEHDVPENTPEETVDKIYDAFCADYKVHCNDHSHPYPGVKKAIKKLHDAGLKTAVLSNKADFAVQDLRKLHFEGLFDYGTGAKKGIRKKPAPDAVDAILKMWNVDKNKALYVGDSEVDLETAKNAGIDVIAVDWGFRSRKLLDEIAAGPIVSNAEDLTNLILK